MKIWHKMYDEGDPGTAGQADPNKDKGAPADKGGQGGDADIKAQLEAERAAREEAQRGFDEARRERDRLLNENKALKESGTKKEPEPTGEPQGELAEIEADIAKTEKQIERYKAANYDTTALENSLKTLKRDRNNVQREQANQAFLSDLNAFKKAHPEVTDVNPYASLVIERAGRINFEDAFEIVEAKAAKSKAAKAADDAVANRDKADKARLHGDGKPPATDAAGDRHSNFWKKNYGKDFPA